MIKVAIIAHTPALMDLGDIYFALAQEVLESEMLASFFKRVSEDGRFIIIDNGAYEKGRSLAFEQVLDAADLIHATEIVCPDVLGNSSATLQQTKDFLGVAPIRDFRYMVVPQGKTPQEWLVCYNKMIDDFPQASTIGLSIYALNKLNLRARPMVVKLLERFGRLERSKAYHLLGLDELAELYVYDSVPIRSLDTSLPVSLGEKSITRAAGFHIPHERNLDSKTVTKSIKSNVAQLLFLAHSSGV